MARDGTGQKREKDALVQSVGFLGRDPRDPSILERARTKLHAGVAVGVLIASADTRRICVFGRERRRGAPRARPTVNNVMRGADVIYFALFAAFVSAIPIRDTSRRAILQSLRREIGARRRRAGSVWQALSWSSRGFSDREAGDEKLCLRDLLKRKLVCERVDNLIAILVNRKTRLCGGKVVAVHESCTFPFFAIKLRKGANAFSRIRFATPRSFSSFSKRENSRRDKYPRVVLKVSGESAQLNVSRIDCN